MDFILDLASGDVENGEEARLHCIASAEAFLQKSPHGYGIDPVPTLDWSPPSVSFKIANLLICLQ